MRKFVLVVWFLLFVVSTKANDVYISQNGGNASPPAQCSSTSPVSQFNDGTLWGTGNGQIASGTTVHICGTITTTMSVPKSEGTGLITIFFESGGNISTPASNGLLIRNSTNSWLIDGGVPCGPTPGGEVACNGVIENTDNGSAKGHQVATVGVDASGTTGAVEIRNMGIGPLYVHSPTATITAITATSTNATVTCTVPGCGFTIGTQGVGIIGSDLTSINNNTTCLQNSQATCYTITGISGDTATFNTTSGAGTGTTGQMAEYHILQTVDNCVYASPLSANITVHDSYMHDVGWCINPAGNIQNSATIEVYNNDFFNLDHTLTSSSTTPFTILFHDNHVHDWQVWDTIGVGTGTPPSAAYHHDGIHQFNGSQSASNLFAIYNNLWNGDPGQDMTAQIFMQGSPDNTWIYNNVFVEPTGKVWADSMLDAGNGNSTHVFNNTVVGGGVANTDSCISTALGGTLTGSNNDFMNNVSTNCNTLINMKRVALNPNTTTTGLDYNVYAQPIAGNNKTFSFTPCSGTNCSSSGTTTQTNNYTGSPSWVSASGEGTHSQFTTSGAGISLTTGVPSTGSILIGAGTNLTTYCSGSLVALCSDTSAGNSRTPVARPASAAWSVGAYQGAPTIDFSAGFSTTGMAFDGSAALNGTRLRLTSGLQSQTGSGWFTTPVNVQSFTTDFTFQLTNANADGFTFAVQNIGTNAIGSCGAGLAYGSSTCSSQPGIGSSVAVKFDLFQNSHEGNNSTGLYTDGATPTDPSTTLGNGVSLHSGNIMKVHITYDGTTLTMTITDTVTNATFTTSWPINIPSTVGSGTAYAGFTGATGGQTSTQEIITWTFNN